jgi:hypothetical protein
VQSPQAPRLLRTTSEKSDSDPDFLDDCLQELRWFYDRRELGEVRRDIAQGKLGSESDFRDFLRESVRRRRSLAAISMSG